MTQGTVNGNYVSNATITGTTAPTVTPAFIGQTYVNTTTGAIYIAMGTSGSWNWGYVGSGALSADYRTGLTSCYDASNGPVPAINGTTITNWVDLGSDANNLSNKQGTPKYYTNIQNGLPAVYFDGSSDCYYGSNLTDEAQPYTTFLVFKPMSGGGDVQTIVMMDYSSFSIYKQESTTAVATYAGAYLGGPVNSNTETILFTAVYNGTNSYTKSNNYIPVTGNAGTIANAKAPIIGSGSSLSNPYKGYVCEWRVYSGALTSAQITQVQTFLNNKWGVY